MPYLTHEPGETKQVVGLPISVNSLEQYCRDMQLLDVNTVYLPGLSMKKCEVPEMVNGVFGIGQLDSHTHNVVAVSGFDVENNELIIRQTPQPLKPNDLRILGANVLPRLRSRDFRGQMISQIIAIGQSLKVDRILAVPAARYANVELGVANYEYVYDRVDTVLKRCGFVLNGQYYELRK